MSRPKHAVELCSLLVDDIYGELSSRIFTILLRRGRLSMVALKRHTQLTTRQLKLGLTVLVRQNLVYHNSEERGDTTYEANIDTAYALVRSGKILEIVGERFGSVATDVMEQLVLLGHAKISDIIAELSKSHEAHTNGNGSGMNGATNGNGTHSYPPGQLNSTLIQLLEEGFIQPVGQNMFRSPTDSYNAVEKTLLQDSYGGATRGTKQKDELRSRIRVRLQELRSEAPNWKPVGYNRSSTNGHMNGSISKRRRLSHNGSATNGHDFNDESNKLDGNLVLRINHEKCIVFMRNRRLVELANSRIGETTSYVYAELLRLLSERIPRCRPDPKIDDAVTDADGPSIIITTQELTDALSKTINVSTGIGKAISQNIDTSRLDKLQNGRKRKAQDEAEVEGDASSDESEDDHNPFANGNGHAMDIDDDDPFSDQPRANKNKRAVTFHDQEPRSPPLTESRQARMMHVMNHLQLLAADDCHLVRKCGTRQMGEWTVDFERVIQRLRELEIDSIIYENFGKSGHRLVRVLRKMGKLEETHISKVALIKKGDSRTKLVEMQLHGMVDIQEVPRDPSRIIMRTVFLWFFDQDRVASLLLDRTYKAMSRCLQRLDVEKRRKADLIALSERIDVQGQEEAMLRPEQMNQLREIRAKEEDLLGQIGRLDDLVGVFCDY
ncbi:hypothetical protein EYC80_005164 [Monilinia laxa]|uniref:DNA-directed RNA polymerase III subunit RPC3 n=1 Tax=Monilinia laxa TaxID=61186 RepID=A0A5N6KJ20_MONLA|nr:hypothetical protein EYC80_005164 [Monilinia laxa]